MKAGPQLFDIHSHLNLPEFDQDWQEVLGRTLDAGCWTVTVGADLASSRQAVVIANSRPEGVWATVGFHPIDAGDVSATDWDELKTLARDPQVVAIGECGLEYFERKSNVKCQKSKGEVDIQKEEQKKIFRKHIELALKLDKPLMIHARPSAGSMDAYEDLLKILEEYKKDAGEKLRGDMHFFAGDWAVAQKCLDVGFSLSFTGVITFARQYDEVIKNAPLEMIMAETDAPFVAPVPYRGTRCEPLYVAEVVAKLAEVRGISAAEMARISVQNGRKLFGV